MYLHAFLLLHDLSHRRQAGHHLALETSVAVLAPLLSLARALMQPPFSGGQGASAAIKASSIQPASDA